MAAEVEEAVAADLTETRRRSWVLGVGIDAVTEEESVGLVDEFIQARGPHQIVTVNPEFVMAAQKDPVFRKIINAAQLATADGAGLIWAARLLRQPLRGRVTGVELVQRLAELAADRGYRIFLLGAAPGVAEAAATCLERKFPKLVVAGTFAGSPAREDEEDIISRISSSRVDILFVAYGHPKQDYWINRNLPLLDVPVAIGIGGALDFISGKAKRAPLWLRHLGLEWLYRLSVEPWRWRRMLALPKFVFLVSLSKIRSDSSMDRKEG